MKRKSAKLKKAVDAPKKSAKVEKFKAHYRELDGTVYAYTCNECGYSWKIYQNQYHGEGCPYL